MHTADGTRAAVHEHLEGLHATYGEFDVLNETVAVDAERYRSHRDALAADGVGRVTVWAGHADRGLLLVRPRTGADVWTTPAACSRSGEPLVDAAVRCVRDAAGLDPSVADVYRVERVELRNRSDPDAPTLHDVTVHFDAVVEGGDPTPGADVEAASFHAGPTDSVDRAVTSRVGDRDPRAALGLVEPA